MPLIIKYAPFQTLFLQYCIKWIKEDDLNLNILLSVGQLKRPQSSVSFRAGEKLQIWNRTSLPDDAGTEIDRRAN